MSKFHRSLCVYHYYYYYYLLLLEFYAPILADSFSQDFEWQQVYSNLQDSSRYSGRSRLCSSLDGHHSASYFQVLQPLYQSFGDCTKSYDYNWYNRYSLFLFNSLARFTLFLSLAFFFNYFTQWSAGTAKSTIRQVVFFCCCWLFLDLVVWQRLCDPFVSQNPRGVCASHSPGQILDGAYGIYSYGQISVSLTIIYYSLEFFTSA